MQLQTKTLALFVRDMAAAMQARCGVSLDLAVGGVLRALLEAVATLALWVQWQALQVLSAARAATSQGADLDSWMADFGLTRLPAAPATGAVAFSRYTAGVSARVPVGAVVKTSDGATRFLVKADPANSAWDGSGYAIGAAATSVTVPVVCDAGGANGNIAAGRISLIASALPGIDTVINVAAFSGGVDGEADAALRTRFAAFINSRSLATREAILYAAQSCAPGLRCGFVDCAAYDGSAAVGQFCLAVTGPGGVLDPGTLADIQEAVENVRPAGVRYTVKAATVRAVEISLQIVVQAGRDRQAATASASNAITAWFETLPVGGLLAMSRVTALVHQTCPDVLAVEAVLFDSVAADVSAAFDQVLVAGVVSFV